MSSMQDLRLAARMLGRDRWCTGLAIVILALGMGATTTVFTIVRGVFLADLPWRDSARLVHVGKEHRQRGRTGLSDGEVDGLRQSARSLAGTAVYESTPASVSDGQSPPSEYTRVRVSANTFALLGQPLLLGRDFRSEEGEPGAEPVVILGYGVWKARYQADPGILGRLVRIDHVPTTVIGVMPQGMRFPSTGDFWQPLSLSVPAASPERALNVVGRLASNATIETAQAEMATITGTLRQLAPASDREWTLRLLPFRERFTGPDMNQTLLALLGAVSFVLLIACGNVATLLLARAGARGREVAVRMALGAERRAILRQLLTESLLLASVAAVLGLMVAAWATRAFDAVSTTPDRPFWMQFPFGPSSVLFAGATAVLAALAFGLVPALHASRVTLPMALTEGGRGTGGGVRARRLARGMTVLQLAMTMVLLVGAGLMVRSFFTHYQLDLGFDTPRLVAARIRLAPPRYGDAAAALSFYDDASRRMRETAGVQSASYASALPLSARSLDVIQLDVPPTASRRGLPAAVVAVGRDYFRTLGVAVRRGRSFDEFDGASGREVAIVNDVFARTIGTDPIGMRIRVRDANGEAATTAPRWATVVGVSGTVRETAAHMGPVSAAVYVPFRQRPDLSAVLVARAASDPGAASVAIRASVRALDPDQPVSWLMTFDEVLATARWPYRTFGSIFSVLAALALLMAGVGLFGIVAWSVSARLQEIGVRMALGATRGGVQWLFVRQAMTHVAWGLLLGLPIAFLLSLVLRAALLGSGGIDWALFAGVGVGLAGIMLLAAAIPARRAATVNPIEVLRRD